MKDIEIIFTGDFYGGNRVQHVIDANKGNELFGELSEHISQADLSITNLESPVFNHSLDPILKTGPSLKAKTNILPVLAKAGFDLLCLANNHILDFGEQGLLSTISAIEKTDGLSSVGAGTSASNASLSFKKTIKDKEISIINICENEWSTTKGEYPGANPLNIIENYLQIKAEKKNAHYLIIILHGGIEFFGFPSLEMKRICRFFVEAGADAVVCHHTHHVSGYESYKGSLIFYGLGNFIFDNSSYKNHFWNQGFMLKLILSKSATSFNVIPFKQCNEYVGALKMNKAEEVTFFKKMEHMNSIIQSDDLLKQEYDNFIQKIIPTYLSYLQPYTNRYLRALYKRGILPSILSRSKHALILNIVRCESHREVLIDVLKDKLLLK